MLHAYIATYVYCWYNVITVKPHKLGCEKLYSNTFIRKDMCLKVGMWYITFCRRTIYKRLEEAGVPVPKYSVLYRDKSGVTS